MLWWHFRPWSMSTPPVIWRVWFLAKRKSRKFFSRSSKIIAAMVATTLYASQVHLAMSLAVFLILTPSSDVCLFCKYPLHFHLYWYYSSRHSLWRYPLDADDVYALNLQIFWNLFRFKNTGSPLINTLKSSFSLLYVIITYSFWSCLDLWCWCANHRPSSLSIFPSLSP